MVRLPPDLSVRRQPHGTPAAPLQLSLPGTSKRGAGGNLRLLWWQAPTILNAHLSQGTKDFDAARPVIEPLASITFRSTIPDVPVLAKEIPSMQNGELAADGTAVTWKLKEGVVWSDGQPFTADDVVFTWQFVTDPKSGAATLSDYETIKDVTAVDPTTVKITFKAATPRVVPAICGITRRHPPEAHPCAVRRRESLPVQP